MGRPKTDELAAHIRHLEETFNKARIFWSYLIDVLFEFH